MKFVTKIFGFEFEENNQEKINESRKMINTKVVTKSSCKHYASSFWVVIF